MLFSKLLELPFDRNTGRIDILAIAAALPNTPLAVVEQVYADHGRKDEFQSTYGNVNLQGLRWQLISHTASELCRATMNPAFRQWYEGVGGRARSFSKDGWHCIDVRGAVVEHWSKFGTWALPPVLLSGRIVGSASELHIVEGHTRMGLLSGLVNQNILAGNSVHQAWLGTEGAE